MEKNPASSQTDIFMKPDPNRVSDMKRGANYEKLSEDGWTVEETVVVNNDVIIGLVNPKPVVSHGDLPYIDNSAMYKGIDPGAIDKVLMGVNSDGYPILMMRVRSEKIPNIGDKFASRNGQKGVCGWLANRTDLPFTIGGLTPDIILNPNAFPKRMTIGQFLECLLSKVCIMKGIYGDASPFCGTDIRKINEEAKALGLEEWSYETTYNGMTGRKLDVKIFIGPTYYQRLKQMVNDKAFSRAIGPTQLLTRQPTAGKSRDGGLKLGEMERDAIAAHGMSQFLRERQMECSDIYSMHICDVCGLIASKIPGLDNYQCNSCKNQSRISKVVVPYCFKLLVQELLSMGIKAAIRTSKHIAAK